MSKLTKIIIIASAVLVLILAGAFTAISIASYKPMVAFYNVPEKVQNCIVEEMKTLPAGKKGNPVKYEYVTLDVTIPLSKNKLAKKASIIFANLDYDVKDFALKNKNVNPLDTAMLETMPGTVRQASISEGKKLFAVPLLYDFYQFDINLFEFRNSGVESINVWEDITNFWNKTKTEEQSPFIFSGGNDCNLLDFLGSLSEAFSGRNALITAEEKLYEAFKTGKDENVKNCINELCTENGELNQGLEALAALYKNKTLNNSCLSFSDSDSLFYLDNNICNSAYLKLSSHRNINNSVINKYTSIYVPAKDPRADRSFASPCIVAIPCSNKSYISTAVNLLSSSRQATLSFKTGLAPVSASCSTPDRQADDVRFWIAASSGPDISLSDSLPSTKMKNIAAEAVRVLIKLY